MFEVVNGVAKIDGSKGIYDGDNITNPSVKYGRNAVANYYSYLEKPISEMMNPDTMAAPILDLRGTPAAAEASGRALNAISPSSLREAIIG